MIEFEILYARKDINEEKKTIGYYLKTHMNNKKKDEKEERMSFPIIIDKLWDGRIDFNSSYNTKRKKLKERREESDKGISNQWFKIQLFSLSLSHFDWSDLILLIRPLE